MLKLEKLHPVSRLLYFFVTVIIPLVFFNPYFSAAALFAAVLYSFLPGFKNGFKTLCNSFAAVLIIGVFNMLFAHWGRIELFNIGHLSFNFEPLVYGFNQGMIFAFALIWFSYMGRCIDSESVVYLFRFSPKTALVFSMILGFIPRFIKKSHDIKDARLALNGGKAPETFKEKLRFSNKNFSALVSYSLESSIITSNSMTARGYNPKAVMAKRFKFSAYDAVFCFCACAAGFYIFYMYSSGKILFEFRPVISSKSMSLSALILYFIAVLYPFCAKAAENLKWKLLSAKV